MSPDPQQAHVPKGPGAMCTLTVGFLFSCGRSRKSPFNQLGGLCRQTPNGCFELAQESQPLEYCASQHYHFLRKVLEHLERKSVFLTCKQKTHFVMKLRAYVAKQAGLMSRQSVLVHTACVKGEGSGVKGGLEKESGARKKIFLVYEVI